MHNEKVSFDTKCVHAGIGEYEFRPVVPPIYQTSTFKFESADQGAAIFKGEEAGYILHKNEEPY
jgi:methionine-gamma-lyase